jgi:hypothetical protein
MSERAAAGSELVGLPVDGRSVVSGWSVVGDADGKLVSVVVVLVVPPHPARTSTMRTARIAGVMNCLPG